MDTAETMLDAAEAFVALVSEMLAPQKASWPPLWFSMRPLLCVMSPADDSSR